MGVSGAPARRVFVSHSHKDNEFSREVVQSLTSAGLDIWYDERHLGAGELRTNIISELETREVFIIVMSPNALASLRVLEEMFVALYLYYKRQTEQPSYYIPVIAEPCQLPIQLRDMHYVDFTIGAFEKGMAEIKRLLRLAGD